MTPLGWAGVWLLALSSSAVVVEGVVMAAWSARLARRAKVLAVRIEQERGIIEADVARLLSALEETQRLWRPYRRALRWLRHPLVVALIGSYRRRLAAR
jgi:hypothetical protein